MKLYYSRLAGASALFAIAGLIALAPLASGADVLFKFGTNTYSGDPSLSTNFLHITALFRDVSTGHVRMTLSAPGLTNNENIDKLYFNLNPADNPKNLVISNFT